jgi:hypothetical protein
MRKVWVLDTETKGTGAQVVPLEKTLHEPRSAQKRRRSRKPPARADSDARARAPRRPGEVYRTPLPAGHVRRTATGEIGRVLAVDAKAGTARVQWLRGGRSSTVALSEVSRR